MKMIDSMTSPRRLVWEVNGVIGYRCYRNSTKEYAKQDYMRNARNVLNYRKYCIHASHEVTSHVKEYVAKKLPKYKVVDVVCFSNMSGLRSDIYLVKAIHTETKNYTVWTCWDEVDKYMKFGHYDLDEEMAEEVLAEYTHYVKI